MEYFPLCLTEHLKIKSAMVIAKISDCNFRVSELTLTKLKKEKSSSTNTDNPGFNHFYYVTPFLSDSLWLKNFEFAVEIHIEVEKLKISGRV